MARKLTPKQDAFVAKYVETGNGTQSALAVYDTDKEGTAAQIAYENLRKPEVISEITRRITPEDIERAHASLINAVRLDYFVFSKQMSDEEIVGHVEAQGLTVINIRPSEKGKLAFFALPDGAARSKGIELYHKVHGTFAPDKRITVNVKAAPSERIKKLAEKLNA